jgi:hypothetical protein
VWYPFSEVYRASLTPNAELNGPLGVVGEDDSRAVRWGKVGDIVHELEDIPARPGPDIDDDDQELELESGGTTRDESMEGEKHRGARRTREEIEEEWNKAAPLDGVSREKGEKVVKIASGSDFLVALKANGEVWFHRVREGEVASWEYVRDRTYHIPTSPPLEHLEHLEHLPSHVRSTGHPGFQPLITSSPSRRFSVSPLTLLVHVAAVLLRPLRLPPHRAIRSSHFVLAHHLSCLPHPSPLPPSSDLWRRFRRGSPSRPTSRAAGQGGDPGRAGGLPYRRADESRGDVDVG